MTIAARSGAPLGASRTASNDGRWRTAEIVFWLVAAALYFVFGGFIAGLPVRLALMSEIVILGLFVLSLDLVLGIAGIVSLGQGAFLGLGAYTAGLAAKFGMGAAPWSDPLLGLLAAGGVTAIFGFVTSFLVLRGSDLTRLMVTLGVALIVEEAGNQLKWLTGGSDGLQGVFSAPLLGQFDFDLYGRTAYLYSLAVLFALFCLARRLVYSPFGGSLAAIRSNPLRARAIGVPVHARLVTAYTVAAAMAGIAGGLLAQTTQFVSLDMLAFHRSADALLVLVFGGSGSLYGALIGAIVFRGLQDQIGTVTPQYWEFWVGFVLILLVLFVRGGLIGLLVAARDRLGRQKAASGR